MSADCLKLTIHFGESDRVAGRLLSDTLLDLFEAEKLHAAVLVRAVEGFGIKQALRTDRLLTLSEDLPLVAIAVDERRRVEALVAPVTELVTGGLVTLERARLATGGIDVPLPAELGDATKLTVYLGRSERVNGRPAYAAVVDHLREAGLAGATVVLGVDGMAHRERHRARFFSRNASVPVYVVSVGSGEAVARALPGVGGLLAEPIVTLERVRVCRRDGRALAEPRHLPAEDDSGLGLWQRLMVYSAESSRHAGHSLHLQLIRRLRAEGAAGATSVRGIWGFSGDHAPHGDRLLAVRRNVPIVTSIVDRPDRIRRWFRIVEDCTAETGLVTSEIVPAYHAVTADRRVGGLRLARPE